jgi:hypothetical protein
MSRMCENIRKQAEAAFLTKLSIFINDKKGPVHLKSFLTTGASEGLTGINAL